MSADLASCVTFARRLLQTPSLPGREEEIAELVAAEMRQLGYHEVRTDAIGNVIGRIAGRGEAGALMFNTHLDHVDVGDESKWPHPPFGAQIHDGAIWGRGAVDIKGPLAAQVHGLTPLLAGDPPAGDVYVTCVVQEEIGGVGARHLARNLQVPWVVVGEPSRNTLRRGHRGRCELEVHVRGKSVHASVPEKGINPLVSLGRLLSRLDEIEHRNHPDLGSSTLAPTLLRTDQTSANVVPADVWQTIDWRDVPGFGAEQARAALEDLARDCLEPGAEAEVSIPMFEQRAYTGETVNIPASNPAYVLAADHPAVRAAAGVIEAVTGREQQAGVWQFATDGSHFAAAGMAPIGFGPGNEFLAHTVDEHIEIAALETALAVNERLARELAVRAQELS